jgi:hypothetical protein
MFPIACKYERGGKHEKQFWKLSNKLIIPTTNIVLTNLVIDFVMTGFACSC